MQKRNRKGQVSIPTVTTMKFLHLREDSFTDRYGIDCIFSSDFCCPSFATLDLPKGTEDYYFEWVIESGKRDEGKRKNAFLLRVGMNVCNPILCFCFAFKVHAPHSRAKGGQGEWTGFPRRGPSSSGPVSRVVVVPSSFLCRRSGKLCGECVPRRGGVSSWPEASTWERKHAASFGFGFRGGRRPRPIFLHSRPFKILKSPASPTPF